MYNWSIDGQDILAQQWFWFRVGNGPGQSSLDSLPSAVTLTTPSTVTASFTGTSFIVTLNLSLVGGAAGSGTSDLSIQANIKNTSTGPLTFHFYEYSDFDFGVSDTVVFLNSNTVVQTGSNGSVQGAVATGLSGSLAPTHHETGTFPNTLNSLNSTNNYTLNDSNSAGPGDLTWAFQWDAINLAAGTTTQLSKDLNVVIPEPSTISLGLLGLVGLFALRRNRH